MEDATLHGRLLAREEAALTELVAAYSKLLWAVAGGILSTAEDTEECVSDVFLELWRKPDKYDPARGSLKRYLCVLAKSRALNRLRREGREKAIPLEAAAGLGDTAPLTQGDDYAALYEAIRGLPQPTRGILIRRYFHGLKPQEIARCMALPPKEVENRLYRGKQALQKQLAQKEGE